jgi:hypothetical protein
MSYRTLKKEWVIKPCLQSRSNNFTTLWIGIIECDHTSHRMWPESSFTTLWIRIWIRIIVRVMLLQIIVIDCFCLSAKGRQETACVVEFQLLERHSNLWVMQMPQHVCCWRNVLRLSKVQTAASLCSWERGTTSLGKEWRMYRQA